MLKFADIFDKGPNFNPMQFIRKSSYILNAKTLLIGRVGGPEARMSTVPLPLLYTAATATYTYL